jgi:hypothetical protein
MINSGRIDMAAPVFRVVYVVVRLKDTRLKRSVKAIFSGYSSAALSPVRTCIVVARYVEALQGDPYKA